MLAWWHRVRDDEDAFKNLIRTLIKYGGGLLGAIIAMGWVPPGLSEHGAGTWKAGLAMMAVFFGLPSTPLDPQARVTASQLLPLIKAPVFPPLPQKEPFPPKKEP
jgi:hypothetical protein